MVIYNATLVRLDCPCGFLNGTTDRGVANESRLLLQSTVHAGWSFGLCEGRFRHWFVMAKINIQYFKTANVLTDTPPVSFAVRYTYSNISVERLRHSHV